MIKCTHEQFLHLTTTGLCSIQLSVFSVLTNSSCIVCFCYLELVLISTITRNGKEECLQNNLFEAEWDIRY